MNENTFLNDVLTMVSEPNIDDICLISHTKLDKEHVALECGHKFNYKPIYTEVTNQKKYKNNYETQQLKIYQLKCPYCRNIQNKILPFYNDLINDFPKIYGVNSPNKHCMFTSKCSHVFKSGKRKGIKCLTHCNGNKCNAHKNIVIEARCEAMLSSGNRKNQRCLNGAKNGMLCLIHQNKKI